MTMKCWCGHAETLHRERARNLPPYCSRCKGGKAGHEFSETNEGNE